MKRIQNTLYNVLDQYTGEHLTYNKVTTLPDGTTITDVHCDGIIYKKWNNEYWKRVLTDNYITPIMFGAKGDGVNDDTAAIQATINSRGATVIYFPPGKYLITSKINFSWSGNSLTFLGDKSAQLIQTGSVLLIQSGAGLEYDGVGTTANPRFEGLKFKATGTLSASTYAVTLNRSYINTFENCVFEGFNYLSGNNNSAGLKVTGVTGGQALLTRVLNCLFYSNVDGIYYDKIDSNGLSVQNSVFWGNSGNAIRGGDRTGTNNFSFMQWDIRGCTFENNTGADIYTIGGANGLTIDSNYFEWSGTKTPIVVSSIGIVTPVNNSLFVGSGNTFVGTPAANDGIIHVQDITGLTVLHPFTANNLGTSLYTVKNTKSGGVWSSIKVETCATIPAYTRPSAIYNGAIGIVGPNYDSDLVPINYTPVFASGGSSIGWTYTSAGSYNKVGNVVYCQIRVVITDKSGVTSGNITVSLPVVASSSSTNYGAAGSTGGYSGLASITGDISPILDELGSSLVRLKIPGATQPVFLTDANFTVISSINFNFKYEV